MGRMERRRRSLYREVSRFDHGRIHGDDPRQVYSELCNVVDEVIDHFQNTGRPLPSPTIRPMREVV